MRFTPKTEDQLTEENLIADNTEMPFEVISAEEKVSASKNDMIALKLQLFENGKARTIIFDWLLEKMQFKLLHFCECTGLSKAYQTGELTANMCEGKTGYAKIGVQKAQNGYPAKNNIKDYIVTAQIVQDDDIDVPDDDDIPF